MLRLPSCAQEIPLQSARLTPLRCSAPRLLAADSRPEVHQKHLTECRPGVCALAAEAGTLLQIPATGFADPPDVLAALAAEFRDGGGRYDRAFGLREGLRMLKLPPWYQQSVDGHRRASHQTSPWLAVCLLRAMILQMRRLRHGDFLRLQ